MEIENTDNVNNTTKRGRVCNVCLTFIVWKGQDMGFDPYVCDDCYSDLLESI